MGNKRTRGERSSGRWRNKKRGVVVSLLRGGLPLVCFALFSGFSCWNILFSDGFIVGWPTMMNRNFKFGLLKWSQRSGGKGPEKDRRGRNTTHHWTGQKKICPRFPALLRVCVKLHNPTTRRAPPARAPRAKPIQWPSLPDYMLKTVQKECQHIWLGISYYNYKGGVHDIHNVRRSQNFRNGK